MAKYGAYPLCREQFVTSMQNDPDKIELRFQTSMNLLTSTWPLDVIYQEARKANEDSADSWKCKRPVSSAGEAYAFLLCRVEWQVKCIRIESARLLFLQTLQQLPNLVEACATYEDGIKRHSDTKEFPIHEWLMEWLEMGLFINNEANKVHT